METMDQPRESGQEESRRLWFESIQAMEDGERVLVGSEAEYFPARREVLIRSWGPEAPEPERYNVPPEICGEGALLFWLTEQGVSMPREKLEQALEQAGITENFFWLVQEAKDLGLRLREAELTPELTEALIRLSVDWEAENSCHGYRKNTPADIEGNRIFLLEKGDEIRGYLFGRVERAQKSSSVMQEGTSCFEVEEFYVRPAYRGRGYGGMLFQYMEECVRGEADYVTLGTATKDWQAILNFYLEEQNMQFWSARLFKKLK